ncbi:MAG: hypothetical protein N2508_01860, partial [Anaerolineae bacterium]|nr:hypothetical protein [Anaerolineae bacterium]
FLRYSLEGFPVQVLSAAMAGGGFRLLSELRDRGVLEETPDQWLMYHRVWPEELSRQPSPI